TASPANRIGLGQYNGGIKMYGPKSMSTVSLSKITNDNKMEDMLQVNTSNNIDIMTNLSVKSNLETTGKLVGLNGLSVFGKDAVISNGLNVRGTARITTLRPSEMIYDNLSAGIPWAISQGKFGIGTSNPSTQLHVIGGTLFTGGNSSFENNVSLNENAQLSLNGTPGPPRLFVQNQSSGGNIGIGTSSPISKLHVIGDGLFTGSGTFTGDVKGNRLCIGSTCVTEAKLQKLNALP
ncbi:MAG TPA: hypothetical protein V6C58_16850, partial [Allocoleopsis sp.]